MLHLPQQSFTTSPPTAGGGGLVWPLVWPLVWGTARGGGLVVTNDGNAHAQPVWRITGPCTRPVIRNADTGAELAFDSEYTLPEGQTLVLTTQDKSVLLSTGVSRSNRLERRQWFTNFADPWEQETSFDAGWLAGLFDGEGCLSKASNSQSGWMLSVAQRPGAVFDRAVSVADSLKFDTAQYKNSSVMGLHIRGGLPGILAFLGKVPTTRLYAKATQERIWEGLRIDGRWPVAKVFSVKYLGLREVVALQTSTCTLIAEGMFSHNCIANGLILDSRPGNNPWKWMPYHGSNPHRKHFHISVIPERCDDDRPWNLPSFGSKPAPNQEDDVSYEDAKKAIVDVLWRERHDSRVTGSDVKLSIADAVLNSDAYGYQNLAMLAAQSEAIRTLAAAVTGSEFDADELVTRIDETVRRTIADATVNVDVNVRGGEHV
ncbi:hypothetical protein [Saccharopolyspora pogona]|uniref:hypothetical protein n=1 Tax=Saccharopolyspora pogona TaxID=333966 RepID=UPI0016850E2C|nr:hypothetical protein [Saccharopolyspora pogona]